MYNIGIDPINANAPITIRAFISSIKDDVMNTNIITQNATINNLEARPNRIVNLVLMIHHHGEEEDAAPPGV
jgi:hypothetical protein